MTGTSLSRSRVQATPTPASTVIRVTLAVVGGVGLLIGTIAVFRTANQAGAAILLVGGLIFVLAAIAYPSSSSTTWFAGWGRRAGLDLVGSLLRSPHPQVRLAAAEAVLGPDASGRRYSSAELREQALDVLLNRDLIRRLADLLRRGGYTVTAADSVDAALSDPAANVLVRVDQPERTLSVPITISNDIGIDVPRVVAELSIAAGRFGTHSAVAIFTGQHDGPVPLSSVTPVGPIRIFTVYSPRLGDEQSVLAAVGQAVQATIEATPPPVPNLSTAPAPASASPSPPAATPNGADPPEPVDRPTEPAEDQSRSV
jgi:hypothetical protein